MANVSGVVFRLWYYYVLAIGFSSRYFDFHQKRLLSPRWLRYYSLFINVMLLLFLPIYYLKGIRFLDAYVGKPLLQTVSRFNVQLQTLVIAYTFTMRRRHDEQYHEIVRHLLWLEHSYFGKWVEESNHYYNRLFYAKLFTLCFQNASFILGWAAIHNKRLLTLLDYILNLYFLIIWTFLQSTVFTYFLTLLHISRRYDVLNAYLRRRLHWQLNVNEHSASETTLNIWLTELRTVLLVHEWLRVIVVQVNHLYRLHITSLLLTFFLSNTSTFYFAFISLPNWSTMKVYVILSGLLFAIKSFDIFLINHCCEILIARQGEALEIFQHHQHQMDTCMEYERMCSDFALSAAVSKFNINIYGMFDMNHRATFTVLRNTIMHALILIQFDHIVGVQERDRS